MGGRERNVKEDVKANAGKAARPALAPVTVNLANMTLSAQR